MQQGNDKKAQKISKNYTSHGKHLIFLIEKSQGSLQKGFGGLNETGIKSRIPGHEKADMTEQSTKTAQDLFALLDGLGIAHKTYDHEPVFTVSESQSLRDRIPGGHTKNLFVKDKKDRYFVLTVEENATVDLKTVHKVIDASSRVSFGRPEKMLEYLGVVPGSVTVFGAINDTGNAVTFVLDADLMKHDLINGHPLSNDATTTIGRDDLIRFLEATGHVPLVLKVTE